jgi:hypothetical protein
LKPEIGAAVPLLLAFYPDTRQFFETLFRHGWKLFPQAIGNDKESRPGLLAGKEESPYCSLNDFLRHSMGNDADPFLSPPNRGGQLSGTTDKLGSLMRTLGEQASKVIDLTCPWVIYDRLRASADEARLALVRLALKRVRDSESFNVDSESERYLAPAREMTELGGIDVVVFGHTHFPKDVTLPKGRYFNAGTWADVLRLPQGISSDDPEVAKLSIEKFLKDMKNRDYRAYTTNAHGYVHAVVEANGDVAAELKLFNNGSEDSDE